MDYQKILDVDKVKIINYQNLIRKSSYPSYRNPSYEKILISTGSKNFDEVLGGGFSLGKKYLIFGANSTGKTQLIHQLCILVYQQLLEHTHKKITHNQKLIYYIDTENTFRPERIKELATARKLDYNNILKSIMVANIMSNSALLLSLQNIEEQIKKDAPFVLFIDSINNYYRSEQGLTSFYQIKKSFIKILKKIDDLNNKFNLLIIATAQVVPNFVDNAIVNNLPVGNQYLNHYFSEALFLSYKDEKNYAHLVNSFTLPEKKVAYKITSEGIKNYET